MSLSEWRARRRRREFWLYVLVFGTAAAAVMWFAFQAAPVVLWLLA